MAEEELKSTGDQPAEEADQPRGGLMGMVKVGVFILAITVVECVVAYLYVGSAGPQTDAQAATELDDGTDDDLEEEKPKDVEETVEVSLGAFNMTTFQPPNTTLRINFELYGEVTLDDQAKFSEIYEEKQHRFREQVLVIVRSSEVSDFTDPVLGLLKRKIFKKINQLVGPPTLRKLIISKFDYYEQ